MKSLLQLLLNLVVEETVHWASLLLQCCSRFSRPALSSLHSPARIRVFLKMLSTKPKRQPAKSFCVASTIKVKTQRSANRDKQLNIFEAISVACHVHSICRSVERYTPGCCARQFHQIFQWSRPCHECNEQSYINRIAIPHLDERSYNCPCTPT